MIKNLLQIIRREIEPIRRRVMGMVSRGTVKVVDDSTKPQTVQVQMNDGEVTFNIEHLQPFGFSSVPVVGADALHVALNANRANGVAVFVNDNRYRPTSQSTGTVCLYTQNAILVRCLPNGTVEIGEEPTQFAARADKVASEINDVIDSLNGLINAYNLHTHAVVPDNESPTKLGTAVVAELAVNAVATTAASNACQKVKAL